MIKRTIFLSVVFTCLLFSQQYESQQYEDVVYLKNGSIIRGMIIEQVPNDYLKIRSGSNVFVYQLSDIEKITKEIPPTTVKQTTNYKSSYSSLNSYTSQNNRQGFVVGFTYGRQSTEIDLSLSYYDDWYGNNIISDSSDDDGSATDFKIGFAPNSSVAIYYTNKVAWFEDDVTLSHAGIGATLFLNASKSDTWKPSAFITGSIGGSTLNPDYDDNYNNNEMTGRGYSFGAGFEPAKNFVVEMTWWFANIDDNSYNYGYDYNYEWDFSVFMFTVGLFSL